MRLVTDCLCEFADHPRIVEVFLLRRHRQQQMILYEPGHAPGIVTTHAVFEAESLGVDRAKLRVVAAPAFGDVVEKPAEIRDLRLGQRLHDATAVGMLVVETGERRSPQILQDEQGVRIDGVGMKEVVLHAADYSSERRDIEPEHTIGVHPPERPGHSLRGTENIQEQPLITWILAKFFVDQPDVLLDQRDRPGVHSLKIEVLFQEQEYLQQRRRVLDEHVRLDRLHVPGP